MFYFKSMYGFKNIYIWFEKKHRYLVNMWYHYSYMYFGVVGYNFYYDPGRVCVVEIDLTK